MYNNNLSTQIKEEGWGIPQNSSSFFIFSRSFIKHSVEILINPFEDVSVLNLYIIIKSYACSVRYIPLSFLIIIKNETSFIAHNLDIDFLKKISYFNFHIWFQNQLSKDWKYFNNESLYSFTFTYIPALMDEEDVKLIKPKYPWNSEIMSSLKNVISEEGDYIRTIEELIKENKKLKEILYGKKN